MSYTILTGASGFIGLPLIKELSKIKNVITLVRNKTDISKLSNINNIIIWNIDINSIEDIFIQYKVDGIVHLATYYIRTHKQDDIKNIIQSNVTFPLELLNLGIKYNIKWFINTGTGSEYQEQNSLLKETNNLLPENLYAQSKVIFDSCAKLLLKEREISYLNMILFSPYGETEPSIKIVSNIIDSFLKNKKLLIKTPNQKLDFLYYMDIVDAYIKAIEYLEKSKIVINERLNLGSNEIFTIYQVVEIIGAMIDNNIEIVYEDFNTYTKRLPNVDKIFNMLKWKSKISFKEGLERMIDSFK